MCGVCVCGVDIKFNILLSVEVFFFSFRDVNMQRTYHLVWTRITFIMHFYLIVSKI